MFSLLFTFTEDFLDFSSQLGKNIIIGRGIVMTALFLAHQRYVDECHQCDGMITLAPFIRLSIGVIALSDEFCCTTIELFVITIDDDLYILIVDMQSDM